MTNNFVWIEDTEEGNYYLSLNGKQYAKLSTGYKDEMWRLEAPSLRYKEFFITHTLEMAKICAIQLLEKQCHTYTQVCKEIQGALKQNNVKAS